MGHEEAGANSARGPKLNVFKGRVGKLPLVNSFVIGTAVINTHTHGKLGRVPNFLWVLFVY